MKTREEARRFAQVIRDSIKGGEYPQELHRLDIAAVPQWIAWLDEYAATGKEPSGGHNPVRLWIIEAPFSPIRVFEL